MAENDLRNGASRGTLNHMAHWGFDLSDAPHNDSPGGRLLLVGMRPTPTYAHYDPERLALHILDSRGLAAPVTLDRNASLHSEQRVCPGFVTLSDRLDKHIHFYCYGGTLEAVHVSEPATYTLYVLESPAPILALHPLLVQGETDQLAQSSEALFARLRARMNGGQSEFLARLARVEPLQLYAGCIESLWSMYRCSATLPTTFAGFYALLQRERRWLARLNSGGVYQRPLEQLLAGAPSTAS
ncbi:MAG TPA: hypothetical protein VNK95_04720 [Caldilineaceae bacterium]|nr:hypothetical protein [Caldilineaceae bacterium]